jgi:hypothetical protein
MQLTLLGKNSRSPDQCIFSANQIAERVGRSGISLRPTFASIKISLRLIITLHDCPGREQLIITVLLVVLGKRSSMNMI